jgi:hypothetical protein
MGTQDVAAYRRMAGPGATLQPAELLRVARTASHKDVLALQRLASSAGALLRCVASGDACRLPFLVHGGGHFVAVVVCVSRGEAQVHVFEQVERVMPHGLEQLAWFVAHLGLHIARSPRFLMTSLQVQ